MPAVSFYNTFRLLIAVVFVVVSIALIFTGRLAAQTEVCRESVAIGGGDLADTEPQDYDGLYAKAWYGFVQKQNTAQALLDINRALQLQPRSARGLVLRGRIFSHQADYRRAVADFTKAIDIDIKNVNGWYHRGRAFEFSGKSEAAISDFLKVIELQPEATLARHGIGLELSKMGREQTAILWWNQAVEILDRSLKSADPEVCNSGLFLQRGMILSSAQRYNDAIADFDTAEAMKPNYEINYYRGQLFWKIKAIDKAIAEFTRAIELNQDFAESYAARATLYRSIKFPALAEADEKRFRDLSNLAKK